MKNVVIIGNGISGITAARHIRKLSDFRITIISSETPYFFSRTALMYVYMGHLTFDHTKPYEDWFWKKNRIDLVFDHAKEIHTDARTVALNSGRMIGYDTLIIACGSRSNSFGWRGEHLPGVQALYSYQDLQKMETNTRGIRSAVIVGGGLIGVELAEMLCSRKIKVTVLVREPAFWNNVLPIEEARMISRHIESHGVILKHETELKEILPDAHGRVKGILTQDAEEISAEFVGIAVGVHPNVEWLKKSNLAIDKGILVNGYLETNAPDVFAIGDCVERSYLLEGRKNIEQVWYTARMMGEVVAQTVCGNRTPYEPGPWFNSAKFFDIEYQTYGLVSSTPDSNQESFYWEHSSGRKAIHMVWDKKTNRFCGINSFGIRLRHEEFDRWLREERSIQYVMEHLDAANFDPEFAERHEDAIRGTFQKHDMVNNS